MATPYDYTKIKRQSPKTGIVICPKCGKMSKKCSSWKMPDGSRNRMYEHAGVFQGGIPVTTSSCIVREVAS